MVEAKWCKEGYTPTVEEYLDIALISFGHKLLMVTALLGMGSTIATQQIVQWITSMPNILKASAIICRLMNDIVSHKVSYTIPSSVIIFTLLKYICWSINHLWFIVWTRARSRGFCHWMLHGTKLYVRAWCPNYIR